MTKPVTAVEFSTLTGLTPTKKREVRGRLYWMAQADGLVQAEVAYRKLKDAGVEAELAMDIVAAVAVTE